MILDKEHLRSNLDEVIWNIEEARISVSEHHIVKLVTIAKYTKIENITTLYELGQRAFGENQIQQLKMRMDTLENLPLEWHMVGTLQKNKINNLIDLRPTLLQSLDHLDLAYALNKKLEAKEQSMVFEIENNFDESEQSCHTGIGLQNLTQRLKLIYPESHQLDITSRHGVYGVRLEIQLKSQDNYE